MITTYVLESIKFEIVLNRFIRFKKYFIMISLSFSEYFF